MRLNYASFAGKQFALRILILLAIVHSSASAQRRLPNIVVIVADDMGYSDLSSYGGEIPTPNIDSIGMRGVKLRSFYTNARCCPTRASLMTGRYPHQVGMGNMVSLPNTPLRPGPYQGYLNDSFPTIAEVLRKHGYATYLSGKWHLGERPQHWPLRRGFDRYFGLISGASGYYGIVPGERDKRLFVEDDHPWPIPDSGFYMTDAFTDRAIGYLESHKRQERGRPFFLYLAYTAPHAPLHALPEDIRRHEKRYLQGWDLIRVQRFERMRALGLIDRRFILSPRPVTIPTWEDAAKKDEWSLKMGVYAAQIDRMDQGVGRVMQTLRRLGQMDETLVIFISDNGGCAERVNSTLLNDPNQPIGSPGSYLIYGEPWANVSNTPFRRYKENMHEGGIISPCLIQWPAVIRPKKGFQSGVAHVMDIFPTALELVGDRSYEGPGRSMFGFWKDGSREERTIYWEHIGNRALRQGDWKLVRDVEDSSWALYDMKNDPAESRDVSSLHPVRVREMLEAYQSWAITHRVRPWKNPSKPRDAVQ